MDIKCVVSILFLNFRLQSFNGGLHGRRKRMKILIILLRNCKYFIVS